MKYSVGDPLRWYTAGVTVSKSYLLCLLSAERLQQTHGIASIPHALPRMAYDKILTGVQPEVALQDLQQRTGRSRKRAHAALELDADVDGLPDQAQPHVPVPHIVPEASSSSVVEVVGASGHALRSVDSDSDHDSLVHQLEALIEQEELEEEAGPSVQDGNQLQDACAREDPSVDHPPAEAKPESVEVARASVGAVAVASQPERASASSGSRTVQPKAGLAKLPRLARWGYFTFSRKSAASSPPYGGIEASCVYHALNPKTGCKKFLRLEGPSSEAEEKCLNALHHWCNMAPRFNRQRTHLKMPLRDSDVPPPGVVEAQEPPAVIKNDVELDKEEEADTDPEPKAKPKASATQKAKAKAREAQTKAKASVRVPSVDDQAEGSGAGSASDPLGSQGSASGSESSSESDGSSSSSS